MVNAELFRKIADKIEQEPKSYDQAAMCVYETECGSAYCIGGYARLLSGLSPSGWLCARHDIAGKGNAQDLLGLTENDALTLFEEDWKPRPDLTVPQALRLIADGKSVSEVSA